MDQNHGLQAQAQKISKSDFSGNVAYGSQLGVGFGHHLRTDPNWIYLRCHHLGSLLSQGRRVGYQQTHQRGTGGDGAQNGHRATEAGSRLHPPL